MILRTILLTVGAAALAASSLVMGTTQAPSALSFDHGIHVGENGMGCVDCHTDVDAQGEAQLSSLGHDQCESCHDVEDADGCGLCHTDVEHPGGSRSITMMYEGFAHQSHVRPGVTCETCHGSLSQTGVRPDMPMMDDCQQCHGTSGGDLTCEGCHQGERPRPADHALVTWQAEHGLDAALDASRCSPCHDQATCDECHQGALLDGSPHPPSWMFDHFAEADYGQDCLVCHETHESCTACHRAMVPVPHAFGPSWANHDDGGEHKDEAEAFAEVCVACHAIDHDDPTCVRCHD